MRARPSRFLGDRDGRGPTPIKPTQDWPVLCLDFALFPLDTRRAARACAPGVLRATMSRLALRQNTAIETNILSDSPAAPAESTSAEPASDAVQPDRPAGMPAPPAHAEAVKFLRATQ